jgi:hypothetical protein
MAGSKADYWEQKILDMAFKAATFTALSSGNFVALFTGTLTGVTPGSEVTGGSYARVNVPAANWTRTGSSVANNATVTFPSPTANWGSCTHFGVFDASTAGNALYYGDLTTARTINNGDSAPSFAVSALTVTED